MLRYLALLVLLVSLTVPSSAAEGKATGHYLFVWAQDRDKKDKDFLAVIDADPASPGFGKLLTSVATDQTSNNAHHTEYEMPASGMLFANDHGANRTMILDLRDPMKPRPAASFESLAGFSMPHSFLRLPNGNVLASFQYADRDGKMSMGSSSVSGPMCSVSPRNACNGSASGSRVANNTKIGRLNVRTASTIRTLVSSAHCQSSTISTNGTSAASESKASRRMSTAVPYPPGDSSAFELISEIAGCKARFAIVLISSK